MAQGRYRHLSFEEREQIAIWRLEGVIQAEMARRLGRSSSTVNRELARNRLPSGGYQPSFAEGSYLARRERLALLERDERLERFVIDRLTEGWEPEQIAGPPWGLPRRWIARPSGARWLKAGNEPGLRGIGPFPDEKRRPSSPSSIGRDRRPRGSGSCCPAARPDVAGAYFQGR